MSPGQTINAEVAQLMDECFHSIEELDLYFLLRRTRPARWTAERLGNELELSEGISVAAVQQLVARRLVLQPGVESPRRYCCSESAPYPAHVLEELERLHRENRFDLVAIIARQAILRIRRNAHVAFWSLGTRKDK